MWIKLFRQRGIQSVMIFFVILLCTALLNGALTMLTSINEPYKQLKEECKPADITIFFYSTDYRSCEFYQNRFNELDEVKETILTPYSYINDEMYVNEKKIEAFADFVAYDTNIHGDIRILEGNSIPINSDEEKQCLIPACIKNEFNLNIGDQLIIKNTTGDLTYIISGIFVEPYSTSTAFDSSILIDKIPKECSIQYALKIYAGNHYTEKDIMTTYQEKYPEIFPGYISRVDTMISNALLAPNIVSAVFLAIGCIMLVISCLIINFMIRHTMHTDAKSIAIYKTIGYDSNAILKMYLTFYLAIVSVASALGIVVSKLLSNLILNSIFENLGETSNIHVLQTGLPCFIFIFLFVLAIIYFIIRKTKNIKPIYALNGLQNTNTKKQRFNGNVSTAFSPMGIALRNILRDKKGIISILLTAIVTIFSINFAMISLDVANSQKENNEHWIGIDSSDVMIHVSDVSQYDNIKSLVDADERVAHTYNMVQGEVILLDWKKDIVTPNLYPFVYDDYESIDLPVIQGRNPNTKDEIAISTKVANDLGKDIGDYIECYVGTTFKTKLLITGLFQTYYQLGDACRLRTDTYTSNAILISYNTCSIYLKEGVNQEQFIQDIKDQIGNHGEVIPRTEAFSSILNMITTPQINGIPPVIILVFIIAGINIFCIVMLKNSDNEKNNGIYKCIGYSTNDLLLSNLYYVGIIALIAIVIAVPLTILSYGNIMSLALSLFGFRKYPITINVIHLIILNTCAFLLFMISTILSSHTLYHVDVRDLVTE
ncbi:ABC transporter permease [Anaerosporobacter sp.]|uniref:ABC transporter permease n=1 Tax=Anaerosporobacter sp. TaxID=1872529 RepID=UPI00286EB7D6|nr:ABC transporter permease [Anaerosporobacter sp.]